MIDDIPGTVNRRCFSLIFQLLVHPVDIVVGREKEGNDTLGIDSIPLTKSQKEIAVPVDPASALFEPQRASDAAPVKIVQDVNLPGGKKDNAGHGLRSSWDFCLLTGLFALLGECNQQPSEAAITGFQIPFAQP